MLIPPNLNLTTNKMSDPLSLIRQFTTSGETIGHKDGFYIFGQERIHESTPTAFRRTLKSDQYQYTVRDVMFFLENASLSIAVYRQKAVQARSTAVVEQDRQALQNYVNGQIDFCPQIDLSMVSNASSQKAVAEESVAASASENVPSSVSSSVKRKLEETVEVSNPNTDKSSLEKDRATLSKMRVDDYAPFSRLTVLSSPKNEFSSVLRTFQEKILKQKDGEAPKPGHATNSSGASQTASHSRGGGLAKMPIIIVPSALTSSITLFNAKEFLENGVYKVFDAHSMGQKPKLDIINRGSLNGDGKLIGQYKIIDDPTKLAAEDWDRVVAAFVSGQSWQFRGWKYTNPVELFQHVLGVHLMFDDRAPDATVQSWNCKILKVNQYKQHINAGASKEFWVYVDDYVRLHKPQYSRM